MIDNYTSLVTLLGSTGLPVHYEMALTPGLAVPCISYMGLTSTVEEATDVTDISVNAYQIKIWSTKISEIQTYSVQVDSIMRSAGYRRTSAQEIYDNTKSMIQKVLDYELKIAEDFSNNL